MMIDHTCNGPSVPSEVIQLEVQLVLAPDNGNRAICSATMTLKDGRKFTEIAEATDNDCIDAAASLAKQRVLSYCTGQDVASPWEPSIEDSQFSSHPSQNSLAKKNGGGTKPASSRQKDMIASL